MTLSPRARKTVLPLVALTLGVALALALRTLGPINPAIAMTISVALIVAASVAAVVCWRALDEVAKDAHKTAWYWGGSFGMLGAFVAYVAADKVSPDLLIALARGSDPLDFIQLGLIGTIVAQLIGYLIVWAGWWFVRR